VTQTGEEARYAIYDPRTEVWLRDTCAGGSWSHNIVDACWFDSSDEARAALQAADMLDGPMWPLIVCRVR
jgi:hypothetical protein